MLSSPSARRRVRRPFREPPIAEDALVFKIRDPLSVDPAIQRFLEKQAPEGGLEEALAYVERYRALGAEVTPLCCECAQAVRPAIAKGAGWRGWQLAIPDLSSPGRARSAFHYLQLAAPEGEMLRVNARLEEELLRDPRIALVYRPAIPYVFDPPPQAKRGSLRPQWAIEECRFPNVWNDLDPGPAPGEIGVIDDGTKLGHPDLGRCTEVFEPANGKKSRLNHASGVAAVLAALRNGNGIDGCCSAEVVLYNVGSTKGISPKDFYNALQAAIDRKLRVVNISLFMAKDPYVEMQVAECIKQGMVLVAGMGNEGANVEIYPAAYDEVIAVGATDRNNNKLAASNTGTHICLSAPGEHVLTVSGHKKLADQHGTSFATPMVSAAAWLALRAQPSLTPKQVADLLAQSVHRTGQYDTQIGHGRLDMCKLLENLKNKTC